MHQAKTIMCGGSLSIWQIEREHSTSSKLPDQNASCIIACCRIRSTSRTALKQCSNIIDLHLTSFLNLSSSMNILTFIFIITNCILITSSLSIFFGLPFPFLHYTESHPVYFFAALIPYQTSA